MQPYPPIPTDLPDAEPDAHTAPTILSDLVSTPPILPTITTSSVVEHRHRLPQPATIGEMQRRSWQRWGEDAPGIVIRPGGESGPLAHFPALCPCAPVSAPAFAPPPPSEFKPGLDDTPLGWLYPQGGYWTAKTFSRLQDCRNGIPAHLFWLGFWQAGWWPRQEWLADWLAQLFIERWVRFCSHGLVICATSPVNEDTTHSLRPSQCQTGRSFPPRFLPTLFGDDTSESPSRTPSVPPGGAAA